MSWSGARRRASLSCSVSKSALAGNSRDGFSKASPPGQSRIRKDATLASSAIAFCNSGSTDSSGATSIPTHWSAPEEQPVLSELFKPGRAGRRARPREAARRFGDCLRKCAAGAAAQAPLGLNAGCTTAFIARRFKRSESAIGTPFGAWFSHPTHLGLVVSGTPFVR